MAVKAHINIGYDKESHELYKSYSYDEKIPAINIYVLRENS